MLKNIGKRPYYQKLTLSKTESCDHHTCFMIQMKQEELNNLRQRTQKGVSLV